VLGFGADDRLGTRSVFGGGSGGDCPSAVHASPACAASPVAGWPTHSSPAQAFVAPVSPCWPSLLLLFSLLFVELCLVSLLLKLLLVLLPSVASNRINDLKMVEKSLFAHGWVVGDFAFVSGGRSSQVHHRFFEVFQAKYILHPVIHIIPQCAPQKKRILQIVVPAMELPVFDFWPI
jgi:hypothetical protein